MSRKIPYKDIMNRIKDDVDYIADEAYRKGLDDAWECARKIILLESEGGMSVEVLADIFDCDGRIMANYSASEAMERIKAYEDEQNKIRVGDEVEALDSHRRAFVIFPNGDNSQAGVIDANGRFAWWTEIAFRKTGKHYDQIVDVLKKMKGEG